MNDINELITKSEEYINKTEINDTILNAMNNAKTIEELLVLKWHYRRNLFSKARKNIFYEKIERICYRKSLSNSASIIEDLINDFTLEQIMQKYNITRQSIKRVVIDYLETNNYNDTILEKLNIFKKPFVPEHDRELVIATAAINMFINNGCYTGVKIHSKFNCCREEVFQYLSILETNEHPIYYKYMALYKKTIALRVSEKDEQYNAKKKDELSEKLKSYTSLNPLEVIDILSKPSSNEFKYFCLSYGFNTHILKEMLKDDNSLMYKLSYAKSNIVNIYNQYVDKYKELAIEVIRQIIILNRKGFKEHFDLYDYYSKTRFNLKELARLASGFNDIRNNTIILQYLDKFAPYFKEINDRTIATLRQTGVMSFDKESINFTKSDLVKAMESINENEMPKQSGVLYYAIKRQVELKNTKSKVNK